MKHLREYIKDRSIFLIGQLVIFLLIAFTMDTLDAVPFLVVLILFAISSITVVVLGIDYVKRRRYYQKILDTLEEMDKKTLIYEMLAEPEFYDALVLNEVLGQTTNAMNDEIAKYQIGSEEYREYIETWIHEIKTPIAAIGLVCENNPSELSKNILEEKQKIEGYVEQALFYARSTVLEKDYILQKISLDELVKTAVKKNAKQLIAARMRINRNDLAGEVCTDKKWMLFVLGQIISNCIKYRKQDPVISFYAKESEDAICLYVEDNGIGIAEKDLRKVLNKGFTGSNGRKTDKSTGIGLYLCKKLCDKMNVGIAVESEVMKYTRICLIFPKNHFFV